MTTKNQNSALPAETLVQVKVILERLFTDGRQWVSGISTTDWRRVQYVSGSRSARRSEWTGPSVEHLASDLRPLLGYMGKNATSETALTHFYMVVRADKKCLDGNCIAFLRPVLKKNFDDEPQLNFHIWFNCLNPGTADDHLMIGWRLEGPEGKRTPHDFFHAQPLRKFGSEETTHGLHERFPESFPTIPLPASNVVELCLTAVLVACGKEALRLFVTSGNPSVRSASRIFWSKVFGSPNADLAAVPA